MAELIVLSYRPGTGYLHKLDIRCKLFVLLLINFFSFKATSQFLGLISILLIGIFIRQKIPLKATLLQTRLFFLLLLFVFGSRAVFTPGDPLFSFADIVVTQPGIVSGALYCWRLLVVLIGGILLISTSRTLEIKSAIQWFLKPIPLIPEKRVAMMISLMVRFLPLILEQAAEISDVQKARGIEQVKNPVRRLSLFTIPLLRRFLNTADRLVLAMESRCYSEQRTDPELKFSRNDFIVSILVSGYVITAYLL